MIHLSSAHINLTDKEFNDTYSILIEAYARTEILIWGENYFRISKEEYRELIAKKEVVFAKIDNCVVGCIHFHRMDEKTYSFGLLAVDLDKKGLGIGRALIDYAEKAARKDAAQFMDLVILRAAEIEIENKIILKEWYERLGYQYASSHTFLEIEPKRIEKSKKLITPVLFDFYRKVLA